MREMIDLIKKHEGYRGRVYKCTEGYDTIGYGFAIKDLVLTEDVCDTILEQKIDEILGRLQKLAPWVEDIHITAQTVIINMCYQMGVSGVMKFKKALSAMQSGDWETAARELLDSKWARQTPNRANELADMTRGIND